MSVRRIVGQRNDEWSANPYRVTDPRHSEHEGLVRKAQREQIMERVGKERAKELRTSDFTKDAMLLRGREPMPVSHHAYPMRLKHPRSFVERTVEVSNLTCHMILQGGALSWSCHRNGDIVVRNGFTATPVATFNVSDEIAMDDPALEALERQRCMTDRREQSIRRAQEAERRQADSEGTTPYATAAQLLGESNYAVVLLNNDTVRIYDTITLMPVTEFTIPKLAEDEAREAPAEGQPEPLGAILPLNTQGNPLTFCVMHRDSAHVISLQFPEEDVTAIRPVLEVLKSKSYRKLKLEFVSAGTDDQKTIIYAGDSNGKIWWIDLQDMLVIDSLDVVPLLPPPPPPRSSRRSPGRSVPSTSRTPRTRAVPETPSGPAEVATAVSAFKDFIVAGSSKGRVVAFLKQPFGEKPMLIIDEVAAHSGSIITVSLDERQYGFWCVSEDGLATFWSLDSYEQIYSARVPVESLVKACAVLPHTVANKVWTITTSGINNVWISESNSSHEEMKLKIDQMSEVLHNQSMVDKEKANEIVVQERILKNRIESIVDTVEVSFSKRLMRTYYYIWLNYKIRAVAKRNRHAAAAVMGTMYQRDLLRVYYLRMVNSINNIRSRKQRDSMVFYLSARNADITMRRFYNKLLMYVQERKSVLRNRTLCDYMNKCNQNIIFANYIFGRWLRFRDIKKNDKLLERAVVALSETLKNSQRSIIFRNLIRSAQLKALAKRRERIVEVIRNRNEFHIMQRYYMMLTTMITIENQRRQRRCWADMMSNAIDLKLLRRGYISLFERRADAVHKRSEEKLEETKTNHEATTKEHEKVAPLGLRLRRIEQLKVQLEQYLHERQLAEQDEDAISDHIQSMRRQLEELEKAKEAPAAQPAPAASPEGEPAEADKPAEATQPAETTEPAEAAEPTADKAIVQPPAVSLNPLAVTIKAMARLRARAINFETDNKLVQKLVASKAPIKAFKAAEEELIKLLTEQVGAPNEHGAFSFGQTDAQIRRSMAGQSAAQQLALIAAVKQLVILFDAIPLASSRDLLGALAPNLAALEIIYEAAVVTLAIKKRREAEAKAAAAVAAAERAETAKSEKRAHSGSKGKKILPSEGKGTQAGSKTKAAKKTRVLEV